MVSMFSGKKRGFLSNFYLHKIIFRGIEFPSSEHAYQYMKDPDDPLWELICTSDRTPGEIKRLSRRRILRRDWNKTKVAIMREILLVKFSDPKLKRKLLKTGSEELIEYNYWNDTFWGKCIKTDVGENNLGKLLMEIRGKLE